MCHFKGQKLHRTEFLNFLTQISALPVAICEFLSCKASQTFWSRLCLPLRMLELLKSAVLDSRLEGQTTCSSITVPRHVLGFALLMWSLSISPGRCCSGSEHSNGSTVESVPRYCRQLRHLIPLLIRSSFISGVLLGLFSLLLLLGGCSRALFFWLETF